MDREILVKFDDPHESPPDHRPPHSLQRLYDLGLVRPPEICRVEIEHDSSVTHWDDYCPCEIPPDGPDSYRGDGLLKSNYKHMKWFGKLGLASVILISWGIALFEYLFQVPANKIGFSGNGGPFSLVQLKVIQEVITLVVFMVFTLIAFKTESLKPNHLIGAVFLVLAV